MTSPSYADAADRKAIRTALDETIVVEAAAGTGKTTELVARIVNVLGAGRATIDGIVAVTFTEKAAGELKLRLRQELERARDEERRGPEACARLEAALAQLEEAHINTFHGFCAELLRERPVEAAIDPHFEVLTETAAQALYRRVFRGWLEEALEAPPEGVRRFLRRRGRDRDDADSAAGNPVDRLERAGWTLVEWRDFPTTWRRDPFDRREWLDRVRVALRRFEAVSRDPRRRGDNLFRDTEPARAVLRRIAEAAHDEDGIEAALVELARTRDFRNRRTGSGERYGEGVSRGDVLAAHAALLTELDGFQRAADADLAALLQRELREPLRRYEEAKSRAGGLDFVDLLIITRDLLRTRADVRAELGKRFTHLFVDEFQDTDPVQAELLLLLAASDPSIDDWRRVTPTPGKLFIVGDPKQSIYRFRRADIAAYWEVRERLAQCGARIVSLRTSFRGVPDIQAFVNRAFAGVMTGDKGTLQADYVPLEPWRKSRDDQPSVVALSIPTPYSSTGRITMGAIQESTPRAVAAWIAWLVQQSGWKVEADDRWRPVQPRDVCVLFRRFEGYDGDVTRPYVEALEAHGVPHLLVGGRSFHAREEVATLTTALAAIEWPDDELSVFATLHGSLFALTDSALLQWRHRHGRFDPLGVAEAPLDGDLEDVAAALRVLGELHRGRNRVAIADTIESLLRHTRAHAGFALRYGGEQALANVLHVTELARRYEAGGGLSFRGFVEELRDGGFGEVAEAPVLEEGSDGVRLMTVHRAKGLEFPVVVLADVTANLARRDASRHLDATTDLCAVRLAGLAPVELLEHADLEAARDEAEGMRVAYVAATRARDVLVVPAVGDGPFDRRREKWLSMLDEAMYPPAVARREAAVAPSCPPFGRDSVLERANGEPASPLTVAPGQHTFEPVGPDGRSYRVTWWDPRALPVTPDASLGIGHLDLLDRQVDPARVAAGVESFSNWEAWHRGARERGGQPSLAWQTVSSRADLDGGPIEVEDVELVRVARDSDLPGGRRFGELVHAALAAVPLDAGPATVARIAGLRARMLGASDEERDAAAARVGEVLRHPLMERARRAAARDGCRRETPVMVALEPGVLVDGQVDLAFEEDGRWWVIDFKTDRDIERALARYRRQVAVYAFAVATATGRPATGILLHV